MNVVPHALATIARTRGQLQRALLPLLLLAPVSCGDFALVGVSDRAAGSPARDAGPHASDAGQEGGLLEPVTFIDGCPSGNPAGLDLASAQDVLSTAQLDPTQRFLYPYDGTVFPAGMEPPLLMWSGPAADAALLRVRSGSVSYLGCLSPNAEGQLLFPRQLWQRLEASAAGARAPIEVQLTTLQEGRASGPITQRLTIANAPFTGSIYYMRYAADASASASADPSAAVSSNAAVARARPGQPAKVLFPSIGGCTGCHSLAANGTRLVAYSQGFGTAFRIDAATTDNPTLLIGGLVGAELAGAYPDGSLYVAPAHPFGVGPRTYFGAPQINAGLLETATGMSYPNAGIPAGAMTPAFSSNGRLLAFNDYALDSGRGLAVMDFAASTHTADNYRVIFQDPASYPAWPSFLPNDAAVVFARGVAADFSANGARFGRKVEPGPKSDLYLAPLAGGAPIMLARAMGYAAAGDADADTYLPFGSTDLHQSYYPSVFPVASGGYYWVFFDAIRNYGNQGVLRQIWGAAIDVSVDGSYPADPSHPAFLVPGQEPDTISVRPVAVIDPCQEDGAVCAQAAECCSGSCRAGSCIQPASVDCAVQGELCALDADCCDRTHRCIAGYCTASAEN